MKSDCLWAKAVVSSTPPWAYQRRIPSIVQTMEAHINGMFSDGFTGSIVEAQLSWPSRMNEFLRSSTPPRDTCAKFALNISIRLGVLLFWSALSGELGAQPAPHLRLGGIQSTNHPVIGPAQQLHFFLEGVGTTGLVQFESASDLGLDPVWTPRSAVHASVLAGGTSPYPLVFSPGDSPHPGDCPASGAGKISQTARGRRLWCGRTKRFHPRIHR